MDVIDWLKVVLREARFVTGPDDALRALPDIGADGPILTTMSLADGDWFGFPVAFHRALTDEVGGAFTGVGSERRAIKANIL